MPFLSVMVLKVRVPFVFASDFGKNVVHHLRKRAMATMETRSSKARPAKARARLRFIARAGLNFAPNLANCGCSCGYKCIVHVNEQLEALGEGGGVKDH